MKNHHAVAQRRVVQANEIIIQEGELGSQGYVIQDGTLEVFTKKDGKEIILATLGPGEVVGEMAMIFEGARTASVRAKEASCLIVMDIDKVNKKISHADPALQALIKIFSTRLKRVNEVVTSTTAQAS